MINQKHIPRGLKTLKSIVNKLDVGKLEINSVTLSKPSKVIKNDAVKKTKYTVLVKKLNNINTTDTSDFVKKADYNTKLMKLIQQLLLIITINMLLLKD